MQHRSLSSVRVVLAVLIVPVLFRPSVSTAADTNRMPEVVVTSTRIPSETDNTPTDVTVIQGADLERQQIRTVSDALREVPGLNVVQSGQPGGNISVFMRGANSNHTLVLIDGVRVNDGFSSTFDFSNLPTDNIERIEVLRGPQSTLYGSEAIGGVINIITKRGAVQPTGSVTFEGGSYDSIRSRFSFADTIGKLSLAGGGSYFSTDNDRVNSALRQRDINASIGYQFLEHFDAAVSGWFRSSHAGSAGLDSGWGANDPSAVLNDENANVAVNLHAQPFEFWDARLILSHNHDRKFFYDPNGNAGGNAWTTTDRDQIDFQNVFTISEQHKLVAGFSFDNAHANRAGFYWFGSPTLIAPTTTSYSGYANYEFTPFARLTLNAGVRLDDFNRFGAETTYRVGARYTVPGTETILRANFGTGLRAPSLNDMFFPGSGNPDLQPERSLGWDVGFEQPLLDNKLRVGANYFQTEFNNLIQYAVTNSFTWAGTMMNVQQAQTIGVETFATWTPVKDLLVRGSYTWLPTAEGDVIDPSWQQRRLLRRPRHSGDLSASYRFLKRFDLVLRGQFSGDHQDYNPGVVKGFSYTKLDVGLSCDVCKHFTVFGRIENFTDEHYVEVAGYPALGRTLWAGGTVKF